jgi:hypothetical protein
MTRRSRCRSRAPRAPLAPWHCPVTLILPPPQHPQGEPLELDENSGEATTVTARLAAPTSADACGLLSLQVEISSGVMPPNQHTHYTKLFAIRMSRISFIM